MNEFRNEQRSDQQKNDLANLTQNASGVLMQYGQEALKRAILAILPPRCAAKYDACTIHIHDLSYYDTSYNCLGVHVQDVVRRPPQHTTFAQMLRALLRGIVCLTNDQSGGIGFLDFDSEAAAYLADEPHETLVEAFRELYLDLNTPLRMGAEKAYVTFNFGLGTSAAARRVAFAMLDAFDRGRDDGSPFLFPNLVCKLKAGITLGAEAVNHDMYQRALAVTARRMNPTYFNCDSTSNASYDAHGLGVMGCRTRVVTNENGRTGGFGRGNVACVTMNLVQMAFEAKGSRAAFLRVLDENLLDAKAVLLHRFDTLVHLPSAKDWMCIQDGFALGAETGNVEKVLRNGTLSIGFIGLWDAMRVLRGQPMDTEATLRTHFDEAYAIVAHMRAFTDRVKAETGLNFSLLASAAEGVTGRFAIYDRAHLGAGHPACEKGFYSNSFHVPVDAAVDYLAKAELEGPFHHLCNGGVITYIEAREMPNRNVLAVQDVIEEAVRQDCNYIGLNFPLDYCNDCGYTGRMTDTCPHCGSKNVRHLRRISGYLAEAATFAEGKRAEMQHRRAHLR